MKRVKVLMTRGGERIVLKLKRKVDVHDFKWRYVVDSRWVSADEGCRNEQTLYESPYLEVTTAHFNGMVKSLIINGYGIKKASKGFYETAKND